MSNHSNSDRFEKAPSYVAREAEVGLGGYLPYENMSYVTRHAGPRQFEGAPIITMTGWKAYVVHHAAYINPNRFEKVGKKGIELVAYNAMGFDLDQHIPVDLWDRIFPGMPYAVAVSRRTCERNVLVRPHVLFFLEFPLWLRPRKGMRDYTKKDMLRFQEIQATIKYRLAAHGVFVDDKGGIQKSVWKNPNYDGWTVHEGAPDKRWTLRDLETALGIHVSQVSAEERKARRKAEQNAATSNVVKLFPDSSGALKLHMQMPGRNNAIFNAVRANAYRHYRLGMTYEGMLAYCIDLAETENAYFTDSLPRYAVRSIAKSIARWVVRKYQPRSTADGAKARARGAAYKLMGNASSAADKQSRGAKFTHAVRASKSCEAVQQAKARLGERASISAVAAEIGMTRKTVAKYWKIEGATPLKAVQEAAKLSDSNVVPLEDFQRRQAARKLADAVGEMVKVPAPPKLLLRLPTFNPDGQSVKSEQLARKSDPASNDDVLDLNDDMSDVWESASAITARIRAEQRSARQVQTDMFSALLGE